MGGGAAHGLDDPGWQAGKVLGHAPVAAGGAGIQPGQLAKAFPFIIDIILRQVAPARLERHDLDSLLRQLVGQRAATGPGPHDDDDGIVSQFVFCYVSHCPSSPYNQLMSLKPRSM